MKNKRFKTLLGPIENDYLLGLQLRLGAIVLGIEFIRVEAKLLIVIPP